MDVGVDVVEGLVVVMVNVVTSERSLTTILSQLQLSHQPPPHTRWYGRTMAIGGPGALDSTLPIVFGARRNLLRP